MIENNCVLGLSKPRERPNIQPLDRYKEIAKEIAEFHKGLNNETMSPPMLHEATMQILNLEIFS